MLLVLAGTGRCPASEVCIVSASSFSSLSAHQPETAAVSRSGSLALNRATRLPSSSPPQAQLSALHPLFSLYHLQLAFILSLRVLFPSLQCRLLLPPTVDQRRSGHCSGCAALLCVRLIFSSPPLAAMAGGFEGRSSSTTTRGVEQVRSRSACAFFQSIVVTQADLRVRQGPAACALQCLFFSLAACSGFISAFRLK